MCSRSPSDIAVNTEMKEELLETTFPNSCTCFPTERSICYVEGTQLDKNMSVNIPELTENVWFESKPPALFSKPISPLVTSRQIYITRVLLNGKLKGAELNKEPEEISSSKEQQATVSMDKKKSAMKFLGDKKLNVDNN